MKPRTILCVGVLTSMLHMIGIGKTQSGAEHIIEKTFQVGPGGTLFLDASIGSVDVQTVKTGVATIRVIPEVKAGSSEEKQRLLANLFADATQQQNDIRVTAKFRRETPDDERRTIRLRFEISVPHDYNLEVNTVGPVTTGDLRGRVKVETAGGNISLGNIEGDVVATSSGGKVKIAGIGGSLTIETGGGSFTAYLSQQPRADSNVSTSGGRIEMGLAPNVGVSLNAVATNGRVMTDDPALTERYSKLNVLQANINGGGPKLVLRADAGRIYLRTQAQSPDINPQ